MPSRSILFSDFCAVCVPENPTILEHPPHLVEIVCDTCVNSTVHALRIDGAVQSKEGVLKLPLVATANVIQPLYSRYADVSPSESRRGARVARVWRRRSGGGVR